MTTEEQVLCIPTQVYSSRVKELTEFPYTNMIGNEERLFNTVTNPKLTSFQARSTVETDENYKQLIPYIMFRYDNKWLAYQRSKAGGEGRLYGKWSVGIGGHINEPDIQTAMFREINEELDFDDDQGIKRVYYSRHHFKGFVNEDATPVGRVHLGLVYIVDVDVNNEMYPRAKEAAVSNLCWLDKFQLMEKLPEMELWSQLCVLNYT